MCSILTPINLYTTPLLNFWQQFSPPEICNHIHDRRSRHNARAEAKVVPIFVVNSLPLWSNSTPLWVTPFLLCTFLTVKSSLYFA